MTDGAHSDAAAAALVACTPRRSSTWRWAWRVATQELRRRLGLPVRMGTPDRLLLEQCILPHYAARPDMRNVLFVGVGWYTAGYEALLDGLQYTTIDVDPRAARYGSRHRHVVTSIVAATDHFAAGEFDLVVLNGVFGWGLNARADVEAALHGVRQLLRPGGELVVGWYDVPRYRPFPFSDCRALNDFEPAVFAPLGLAAVNEWLDTTDLPGPRHPISPDEVERYYRQDADLLALYLRLRRMDRFLRTRVLRRQYDYVLPGHVSR